MKSQVSSLSDYAHSINGIKLAYVFIIRDFSDAANDPTLSEPLANIIAFEKQQAFTAALNTMGFHVEYLVPETGVYKYLEFKKFLERYILTIFPDNVEQIMIVIHSHGNISGMYFSDGRNLPFSVIDHSIVSNVSLNKKVKWIIYSCCHGEAVSKKNLDLNMKGGVDTNVTAKADWAVTGRHPLQDKLVLYEAPEGYAASGYTLLENLIDIVFSYCQASVHSVNAFDFCALVNKQMIGDAQVQSPDGTECFTSGILKMISQAECTCTLRPLVHFSTAQPQRPQQDPVLLNSATLETTNQRICNLGNIFFRLSASQRDVFYFSSCCVRNYTALTTVCEKLDEQWKQKRDHLLVEAAASASAAAPAPLASSSSLPMTGASAEMVGGTSSSVSVHCLSPPPTPLDAQRDAVTGTAPLAVGEPVVSMLETSSHTTSTASNVEVNVTVARYPTALSSVTTTQVAGTSESSRDSDRDELSATSPKRARTSPDAPSPNSYL